MVRASNPPPRDEILRTIVEQPRFVKEKAELPPSSQRRIDEVLEGACFYLARRPDPDGGVGQRTPRPGVYAFSTHPWNTSVFDIFYSFDDERVFLESIVVVPDEDYDPYSR